MSKKREMVLLIVEDMDLAKIISRKYFGEGITYMSLFPAEKRDMLIRIIEKGEGK